MKVDSLKQLKDILDQIHEPNEYILTPKNMTNSEYWIWELKGGRVKNFFNYIDKFRPYHARTDIFVNGQFIRPADYIVGHEANSLIVKFKKQNFAGVYDIAETDDIKIKGDIEIYE
jgi:hypothetical protein